MTLRAVLLILCSATITFSHAQSKKTAGKTPDSPVLFTVNRKAVSADEFLYLYKKNNPNKADYTPEKVDEYVQLLINFKLKVEEARSRRMDTTAAFRREYNHYKEELRKPYLPDTKIIDSLVRVTYQRLREEVRAAHILVMVAPDAADADTVKAYERAISIRNRIIGGEDFAKVAVETSEDRSAQTNHGDLGYFTALQMVYAFENAAYQTKVNDVSMPVRSRFGYHIIKVTDRRPASGEVEVSHIMVRTGEVRSQPEGKDLIFDIHDQIRGGLRWDEVCRNSSEDPGTKDSGGRLRPFGIGMMSNVPEFERVAFELQKPGEISDPFETQYGWHIIKLERKIALASFEEISTSLKARVARDERAQLSKKLMQQKFRKQYRFTEDNAVKQQVFALADTTLTSGNWKIPVFPKASKKMLFSLKDKNYPVQDFLHYVHKQQQSTGNAPKKYIEQLYNTYVDTNIQQLAEEDIIKKNPEFTYLLQEYYEGILLFEIMEKEVWKKASEDSVGQHNYYNNNRDKYKAGERVKAAFYSSSSTEFVEPLRALLKEGKSTAISDFISRNRVKAEAGYYKRDERAILKQLPWSPGIYSAENNGMYYLAWLKEILSAGNMSFEEARPSVVSDFQGFLENKWLAELKKKFPVRVNDKGRAHILQQLQK